MQGLTIGQVARRAGVHVETIRYYQRLGLLEVPPKPPYGCRRYRDDSVQRLRFIRRAQRMGFTLREIGELLSLDRADCAEVRVLAEQKLAVIEAKIEDLEGMRAVLHRMIETCRTGSANGCSLLRLLQAEEA